MEYMAHGYNPCSRVAVRSLGRADLAQHQSRAMATRSAPRTPLDPRLTDQGTYYYFIPSEARNGLIVVLGEFMGTFMFLLLAFVGAQAAITTNQSGDANAPMLPSSIFYIAASFGLSLAVNVWIFFRISGGMFNPAVSWLPLLSPPSLASMRVVPRAACPRPR